jgi:hypothetical protein
MPAITFALAPRYRGAQLIASGGMADVYVATDEMLERLVAIKALGERFADDPEVLLRFTREARIAARLSNVPNVVTIYDVADAGGRPTIVMEFLSGGTLADRLRAGRVPPALTLAWLEQAARALDAAHAAGVVHRDVKPANLMLGADQEVRVTDFGIARAAGEISLTSAGTILGTSGYISPEQAVGGTATAASDRYGLAVVAFELLGGRRPYVAETFAAEAGAHATAPIPSAAALNRELPPGIDAVFERGLAKDPDVRYPSCAELVAALRAAFYEGAGVTARVPAPTAAVPAGTAPSRRALSTPLLLTVLGAMALAGALLGFVLTRDDPTTVLQTTTVAGTPQVQTVTVQAAPADSAAPPTTSATTASSDGAALNDEGFRLLQAGNAAAALPILERAVSALHGSGSLAEAYASYNLALARLSTDGCDGVGELLDRSERIQGKRSEISRLRKVVRKECDH